MLRLHRAADERHLAELGSRLETLQVPTLVVWGDADPWFARELADSYAARLSDATVAHISDAGHWPWLDQPHVIDLVVDFLSRP
jgi:pimeloyl-ACP methyl ester carboxylesterase